VETGMKHLVFLCFLVVAFSDDDVQKTLRLVQELDLSRIEESLTFKQGWSQEFAAQAVEEYKRFLQLHIHFPDQRLVPSLIIDEVWHTHILFTRQYSADCDAIFGEFLHHEPTLPSDGDDVNQADKDDYGDVVALYTQVFAQKPGRGWKGRVGASCSGACGGGACGGKKTEATCSSCGSGSCSGKQNATMGTSNKTVSATCSSCGSNCSGSKKKTEAKCSSCGSGSCSGKQNATMGTSNKTVSATCGSNCSGSKKKTVSATCGSNCGSKKKTRATCSSCGSGSCSGKQKKRVGATCGSCGSGSCSGKGSKRSNGGVSSDISNQITDAIDRAIDASANANAEKTSTALEDVLGQLNELTTRLHA